MYKRQTEDKTVGAIVEVNCETDFVAHTDNFKNFCKNLAKHVALSNQRRLIPTELFLEKIWGLSLIHI